VRMPHPGGTSRCGVGWGIAEGCATAHVCRAAKVKATPRNDGYIKMSFRSPTMAVTLISHGRCLLGFQELWRRFTGRERRIAGSAASPWQRLGD